MLSLFASAADSADAFKTELNRVLESKDWDGLLALCHTEGMTDYDWKMAEAIKTAIFDGRSTEGMQLIELPENFDPTFIHDGRFFEPTTVPIGLVEIKSDGGDMKIPYTILEGDYRLVATKSRSLNWEGPADHPLGISVMGQGFEKVDALATWNVSGMTIEKKLTHTSTNFNGQFIESVTIISENKDVSLQISVFENGEKIYVSDYLKGVGELSYQRDAAE